MEQYNHTMDSRKNKHLNAFERGQIQLLLEDGLSVYAISQRLCRAYNTIKSEIRRGTVTQIKGGILRQPEGLHQNEYERKKHLGRSIFERPECINDCSEFGHWEIGRKTKDDEALLTLTERLTRKEIIRKIPGKNSAAAMQTLNTLITEVGLHFSTVSKSITSENGSEFSELVTLEPRSSIYFTHPYTSSERGMNERHNGLIRRFIPKGRRMSDHSVEFVAKYRPGAIPYLERSSVIYLPTKLLMIN